LHDSAIGASVFHHYDYAWKAGFSALITQNSDGLTAILSTAKHPLPIAEIVD
jgi:hypothetical protein